ncbi:MAG: hypothetical protein ACYC3I_12300 [Gemmataceae bacterium]
MATDGLGITQPTPTTAQATTTVQLPGGGYNPGGYNPGNPFIQEIEQILAEIEAEIQQFLSAEMTMVSSLLHTLPKTL